MKLMKKCLPAILAVCSLATLTTVVYADHLSLVVTPATQTILPGQVSEPIQFGYTNSNVDTTPFNVWAMGYFIQAAPGAQGEVSWNRLEFPRGPGDFFSDFGANEYVFRGAFGSGASSGNLGPRDPTVPVAQGNALNRDKLFEFVDQRAARGDWLLTVDTSSGVTLDAEGTFQRLSLVASADALGDFYIIAGSGRAREPSIVPVGGDQIPLNLPPPLSPDRTVAIVSVVPEPSACALGLTAVSAFGVFGGYRWRRKQ